VEHALAISFGSIDPGARDGLVARAAASIEQMAGGTASVVRGSASVLLLGGGATEQPVDGAPVACTQLGYAITTTGEIVTPTLVGRILAGATRALHDIAPPAAAIARRLDRDEMVAFTDTIGLKQLFFAEANGVGVCSTSSNAIAALIGAPLDDDAIGPYALLGYHLGNRTAFRGVHKVPGGCRCQLVDGRAVVTPYVGAPRGPEISDHYIDEGVDVIRDLVTACVRAYPDAVLELSGGFDSRMLAAALAPADRRARRAFTLASSETENVQLARQIVEWCELKHEIVDPGDILDLAPAAALDLCERASTARDHGGNAIDCAALDWSERNVDQGGRLTGQNGEFVRSEFYKGVPAIALDAPFVGRYGAQRVAALVADWKLLPNRALDPSLFADGYLDDARSTIIDYVAGIIEPHAPHVSFALDELYDLLRMYRWVGAEYSAVATRRPVLAPFFAPGYLDWSRTVPARAKQNAYAFACVLQRLDPALAAIRLDGRPFTPNDLATTGMRAQVRRGANLVQRAQRKLAQRRRHAPVSHNWARSLAEGIVSYWQEHPDALETLRDLPFLDHDAVHEMVRNGRVPTAATVGLLVSLDVMLRTSQLS
jgi:asparagine synthase (glutamine-hydrolysing)